LKRQKKLIRKMIVGGFRNQNGIEPLVGGLVHEKETKILSKNYQSYV
jgi:hypothetical protein